MNLLKISRLSLVAFGILGFLTLAKAATSLDDALRLAKTRNGTVQAAEFDVSASRSGVGIALSDYFPSLTPRFSYDSSRRDQHTGTAFGGGTSGSNATVNATWKLWDNGTRRFTVEGQKASLRAEEARYIQTLRQVLFNTISQYYDALRAGELVKVQDAQVARTELVLDQTKARVNVGDVAGKDIFQAEADELNAKVNRIVATNRLRSSEATLKSTIGWSASDGQLNLIKPAQINLNPVAITEAEAKIKALTARPELIATKNQIENLRANSRLTKLNNGLSYSVDANYTRSFARDVYDQRSLGLTASIPLFNGGRSQAENRRAELGIMSSVSNLEQQERGIIAEVETAYSDYSQNILRLQAAQKALAASQKNFDAASESQKVGTSSIIEVVTAQASLVVAEVNAVEAFYDALISESRLKLAMGDPLPGEESN